MFAAQTKTILRCMGAERDLIYNDNLENHIEMFSLVKINKKKRSPVTKYSFIHLKLQDLMFEDADKDLSGFISKGRLLEHIRTSSDQSAGASVSADAQLAQVKMEAEGSTESKASQFDLIYETVNLRTFRKDYESHEIHLDESLKSTERLAFVNKIVRNSKQVELFSKISILGSLSGKYHQAGSASAKAKSGEAIHFCVPKDSIFAFGLAEIHITADKKLKLPIVSKEIKRLTRLPSHFGKAQKKKDESTKKKGETEDKQQSQ